MTLEDLIEKTFLGKRLVGGFAQGKPVAEGVVRTAELNGEYHSGYVTVQLYFTDGRSCELGRFSEFTLTEVEAQ